MGLAEVDPQQRGNAGLRTPDGVDVYRQNYDGDPLPEGVLRVNTRVFPDEHGGHFMEAVRLAQGEIQALSGAGVKLNIDSGQVNVSVVPPGVERFGHLHRGQDELWIVVDGGLTVALFDVRSGSPSLNIKSRVVLSTGQGLFIPHGVVHGLANYTSGRSTLVYFADRHFSAGEDTQEWRVIPEDPEFWGFARPDRI